MGVTARAALAAGGDGPGHHPAAAARPRGRQARPQRTRVTATMFERKAILIRRIRRVRGAARRAGHAGRDPGRRDAAPAGLPRQADAAARPRRLLARLPGAVRSVRRGRLRRPRRPRDCTSWCPTWRPPSAAWSAVAPAGRLSRLRPARSPAPSASCAGTAPTKSIGSIISGGKPPSRVASATTRRANGNSSRGHWISSSGCRHPAGCSPAANRPP